MNKIKKYSFLLMICLMGNLLFAHDSHYDYSNQKHWTLARESKTFEGSFFMYKNGNVYIETDHDKIINYPLTAFTKEDQAFVLAKYARIEKLNHQIAERAKPKVCVLSIFDIKFFVFLALLILSGFYIFKIAQKQKIQYLAPIFLVTILLSLYSFTTKVIGVLGTTTDPAFVNSAFSPFKPNVNTRWDNTYFYAESLGIPEHLMMSGITGWQQQFPIPQCYIGSNAWSIPLNPVKAATPVPVNAQHFLRGAVAIAANGVAIFNPYTNTGVDALLDGQLDNYGGHCGRADDYHYHIAPLFLDDKTADILPIAFALDGYAVYGSLEPDGSAMKTLDANHGHDGSNGVYHYHGTPTAPYMIGNMVGQVTEDATLQIIPQAAAKGVRPAGTPLKGAVITSCIPNKAGNGYKLTYTLSGGTDSVVYSWTPAGFFTFNYYVSGVKTTTNYTGTTICKVSTASVNLVFLENEISIYPNPVKEVLNLKLSKQILEKDIQEISVYSLNGEMVYHAGQYVPNIDIRNLSRGIYLVKIQAYKQQFVKKISIQ